MERKNRESISLSGSAKVVVKDAKTGRVTDEIYCTNVITDNGRNTIARGLVDGSLLFYAYYEYPPGDYRVGRKTPYIALGEGSGTPAPTDTELFALVEASVKSASISYSGNTWQYFTRYMPEDANGHTYTELGVYETGSHTSGVLINHLMLPVSIEKTPDILVDVYVTITVS